MIYNDENIYFSGEAFTSSLLVRVNELRVITSLCFVGVDEGDKIEMLIYVPQNVFLFDVDYLLSAGNSKLFVFMADPALLSFFKVV